MHENLLLTLGLVITVSFLVILAQKLKIAYPLLLVIAGIIFGFIPQIPTVHIDPNIVFLIILPPVLFDAAQNISWKALWKWRRIISVMAFGYVLLTATAVAFVSYLLIPGFTLAQGFLLGAIVSPPDAAAATSVLRQIKLPKGMRTILEGESLLNDAASLTIFRFALAAVITGAFSWYEASTGFLLITISGILVGLVISYLFYAVYRWLPTTSNLDVALSLALPYLLYMSAEAVHSSGVLSVVTGGIFIAYHNHFVFTHSSRLKSRAIWSSIVFILNAVIFLLIGFQLTDIVHGLTSVPLINATWIALVITLVIIVIRIIAGISSSYFTSFISKYITVAQSRPGIKNPLIISWIGMRGVVSLASALSIPLMLNGHPFPFRNLILFITFVVIIITLVFQGLTIPWVIRKIKPESLADAKPDDVQVSEIEYHLMSSVLKEMEDKYKDDHAKNELLKNRVLQWQYKINLIDKERRNEQPKHYTKKIILHYKKVMGELLHLQRRELDVFRKKDGYDDDVTALIERRLDLESEGLKAENE